MNGMRIGQELIVMASGKGRSMKIVHNVQVYPIYSGHINDHKVLMEGEFDNKQEAIEWVARFNELCGDEQIAVYTGAIDDETGENL